ncbi:lanthionine synthetase LanC family protein [Mucilaginibacter rubeus]|uniref:Uncharacterized protein n=1 Tax=Mucilaginibacter rubeus TaxID=2027860 RepID=A0A5C1I045_9SPHI|nr:lanthionine synthetase LanC family protein [Mucilaginibacter rubeus]QEM11386.1 hypothetical protein DEO27_015580 [Mucilaginibacter rubeus]
MNNIDNFKTYLSGFEQNCANDYSLYNGKTGLAMLYYMLHAASGDQVSLTKGKQLLDELSENIQNIKEFNFQNGLSGIGWAIEWLVQNKFIDANTDEILEDMDDELYRSVVYAKSGDASLAHGVIGKALYFYRRLCARNSSSSRYRYICIQECLVLLIDEIDELLFSDNAILYNGDTLLNDLQKMHQVGQALLLVSSINRLKINAEVCKKIICCSRGVLDLYFNSNNSHHNDNELDWYLTYCYYKSGIYLGDSEFLSKTMYGGCTFNEKFMRSLGYFSVNNEANSQIHVTLMAEHPLDNSETGVFNLFKEICHFPQIAKYNWEEGWGL